jgi:hypothetical protein
VCERTSFRIPEESAFALGLSPHPAFLVRRKAEVAGL